jgi:hypothetical protein
MEDYARDLEERAAALLEPALLSSALRGDDGVEERRQLLERVAEPFLGDGTNVSAESHARADQALLDLVRQLTNGDVPVARMAPPARVCERRGGASGTRWPLRPSVPRGWASTF